MGAQPPFLYDAVPKQSSRIPYSSFDPKAVSRASLTPKPPRPKSEGPLISFNQHPDSYLIVPYGNTNATPMNPSVKTWVKWTRVAQLPVRCLELLGGLGLLVMMILIKNVEVTTGWIMRIVPGVAIAHTIYGIYHLSRKASGRTPASSASYMLFAAFFDVSIIPFYAFGALVAKTRDSAWATILSNQDLMSIFPNVVFLLATISSGLHLISLGLSIYLAVTFRRITELPPDMNPLEDHLTSRPHKRNKSSVSTTTLSEKRSSLPSESNRTSGVPYEDLGRPPTIPFMHTRTGSNESFSTYQSSTPPGSRGSQRDFPNRQYQVETNHSPRSSTGGANNRNSIHGSIPPSYRELPQSDTASQRSLTSPYRASSPPKRTSYTELPLSDRSPRHSSPALGKANPMKEAWYNNDAFKTANVNPTHTRTSSPNFSKKGLYQALQQSSEDLSMAHPNGLGANPPTPRHSKAFRPQRESPLAEISNNRTPSSSDIASISNYSQDGIDDFPKRGNSGSSRTKSKYYGELKPTAQLTPILVGADSNRQVSSGIDFESVIYSNEKGSFRRDVSGKVAEEGRSTRFRRVSGMLQ